jgi:hypothetical protein
LALKPGVTIVIVIVVLTHVVESILVGHLHDQLVTGLDDSFELGFSFVSFSTALIGCLRKASTSVIFQGC